MESMANLMIFCGICRKFDKLHGKQQNAMANLETGVSHARMVVPPCCSFELSPLNEVYRGKLVCSVTLLPYETFDDIWYTYIIIRSRRCVACKNG